MLAKVLPPAGLPRRLATQSAIYAIGNGTYLTGSVVFFSVYVGLSPVQIGIGFSFAGFLGLIGSLPFGHLADRIGGRRAWVIGALAGAAAFAAYPLVGNFWAFLLVLGAETLAEVLANAGRMVYTLTALPKETRVRTMAFTRAYLNVGFTVGSGLGAAAIALDSRPGLLALVLLNAAGMLVNAAFVARMPATPPRAPGEAQPSPWGVLRDHPFAALGGILGLFWLHGNIFNQLIPLWAITMTDAPKPVLGALFALNTVMAVTLQVRATRGATSMPGSVRLLRRAMFATALACPVVALSGMTHGWVTVAVLALAVALTTTTELWGSAAQWFFQAEIPPADQRGVYNGAVRSLNGVTQMVGPASLTFLAVRTGGWGWWLIAGLFTAGALTVRPVIDWIARTPRNGAQLETV